MQELRCGPQGAALLALHGESTSDVSSPTGQRAGTVGSPAEPDLGAEMPGSCPSYQSMKGAKRSQE